MPLHRNIVVTVNISKMKEPYFTQDPKKEYELLKKEYALLKKGNLMDLAAFLPKPKKALTIEEINEAIETGNDDDWYPYQYISQIYY